jgi:hypothetical protein
MHAAKTLGWAGATPLLTAFSRPKARGVAPARPEQLGAVFWPCAYKDVIDSECREEMILINERRKSRWLC